MQKLTLTWQRVQPDKHYSPQRSFDQNAQNSAVAASIHVTTKTEQAMAVVVRRPVTSASCFPMARLCSVLKPLRN
jgi:hypothetical protein